MVFRAVKRKSDQNWAERTRKLMRLSSDAVQQATQGKLEKCVNRNERNNEYIDYLGKDKSLFKVEEAKIVQ